MQDQDKMKASEPGQNGSAHAWHNDHEQAAERAETPEDFRALGFSMSNEEAFEHLSSWARQCEAVERRSADAIRAGENQDAPVDREEARRFNENYERSKTARLYSVHAGHDFTVNADGTIECEWCGTNLQPCIHGDLDCPDCRPEVSR